MTSRFLSKAATALTPYTPGEQPQDQQYIKLNTNECPFSPAPGVEKVLQEFDYDILRLYPDPLCIRLREAMARCHGLSIDQVFAGGGSDEVLAFFFMAFFDRGETVYFPDITYGFYSVYAELCGLEAVTIPLREDFSIAPEDYFDLDGHMVIANPNAPTGLALSVDAIESILQRNPNRLVLIDEAYIDFAQVESCIPLLERYDNLLVIQTYSKSRALAGMRIGCGFSSPEIIDGLRRIKFSFNPYNLDWLSLAVGIAATEDKASLEKTVTQIVEIRDVTRSRLEQAGYTVLPSQTNFLFAKSPSMPGLELCETLRKRGILVRQFQKPRISDFVRITIGTEEQMKTLCEVLEELA